MPPAKRDELRRQLVLQIFGKGGDTVRVQPPFFCDYGSNIELGEHVFFNFNCTVLDVCKVTIGDYCQFGSGVQIVTPLHPLNADTPPPPGVRHPRSPSAQTSGSARGAIILPGVTIGSRTVVGAGSVVSRSLPSDVLAVGNPCRVIRANRVDTTESAEPGLTSGSASPFEAISPLGALGRDCLGVLPLRDRGQQLVRMLLLLQRLLQQRHVVATAPACSPTPAPIHTKQSRSARSSAPSRSAPHPAPGLRSTRGQCLSPIRSAPS